jgi:hypothetical protein
MRRQYVSRGNIRKDISHKYSIASKSLKILKMIHMKVKHNNLGGTWRIPKRKSRALIAQSSEEGVQIS